MISVFEDDLAQCQNLGELMMLALFLCAVYGEETSVTFSAGFNNIDVELRVPLEKLE